MKWLTALLAACVAAPVFAQETPPPPPDAVAAPSGTQASSNSRYLLLPDISFISLVKGLFTSDKTNPDRNKFIFDSGELAIQSFVYPGIKQDAFIVFGNGEAVVEEGYVTVQDLHFAKLPLSATVGRRKAPFGRVNQLHPHSWAYIEPPTVLKNLVADESLTGDGGYLSYLFPSKFFLQLDAGYWSKPTAIEDGTAPTGGGRAFATRSALSGSGPRLKSGATIWRSAHRMHGVKVSATMASPHKTRSVGLISPIGSGRKTASGFWYAVSGSRTSKKRGQHGERPRATMSRSTSARGRCARWGCATTIVAPRGPQVSSNLSP